jgi:histidine triad (HIT) family protein
MEPTDDCLFCRIAAGLIPATTVHETELSLAFRDLNPAAPTHVLVIPKRHIVNADTIGEGDGAVLEDMFRCAQAVAQVDHISESGYRLVLNVGEDSGNSVPHLHLHVVGGRPMGWPPFAG